MNAAPTQSSARSAIPFPAIPHSSMCANLCRPGHFHVPVRVDHNPDDILDIRRLDLGLEMVAHAVDEDRPRARPLEWLGKLLRHEAQIESLLVGKAFHAPEALGEGVHSIFEFALMAGL